MSATDVPELEAGSPQDPRLVQPSRINAAGAGWDWIAQGWKLFVRAPLMWIISIVIVFIAAVAISLVPIVGSLAFQLLQAVIAGGFMVGCHSLAKGGDYELEHLLAGFRQNFVNLLLVGVIFVVGGLVILLVMGMFVGMTVLGVIFTGSPENVYATVLGSAMSILLGLLIALALMVPLLAAYWFAPALVILNNMGPVAAMKESFFGCFRNFVAFLVYGIVMTLLALVAAIPFGLGFLVWIPVAITSTYAAYRAIFTEPDAAEAAVTI
ncbi:MAG TPA: BPSS1780 family membrane protein [Usitatibacter sp.]|nr:BPSS1780 family membrane protein [Usitatibacter sp.]